ncbi:MAG: TlpA disulfide reductase family protein [Micropruina sp.]
MNRPYRARRLRAAVIGAALLAVLTGCAPAAPPSPPAPAYTPVDPAVVLQARKEAGIPGCPKSSDTVPARADGLPDLTLDCLGGDSTVRLAGLRGKPMVINLWAQWCPPCREEAPWLREFAGKAKGKVLLLGLNYTDGRPDLAVEFASLVRWKFPQLADPGGRLSEHMPVRGLPLTLFVNADGAVVHQVVGKLQSYEELVGLTRDKLGVKL